MGCMRAERAGELCVAVGFRLTQRKLARCDISICGRFHVLVVVIKACACFHSLGVSLFCVALLQCTGRRLCAECGDNFNLADVNMPECSGMPAVVMPPMPPPVGCENKMRRRADDAEEVVLRRLAIFRKEVLFSGLCEAALYLFTTFMYWFVVRVERLQQSGLSVGMHGKGDALCVMLMTKEVSGQEFASSAYYLSC